MERTLKITVDGLETVAFPGLLALLSLRQAATAGQPNFYYSFDHEPLSNDKYTATGYTNLPLQEPPV